MTKRSARELARKITIEDCQLILQTAYVKFRKWTLPSRVDINASYGYMFNIYAKKLQVSIVTLTTKASILYDFGQYYPGYDDVQKDTRKYPVYIKHASPKLITDNT